MPPNLCTTKMLRVTIFPYRNNAVTGTLLYMPLNMSSSCGVRLGIYALARDANNDPCDYYYWGRPGAYHDQEILVSVRGETSRGCWATRPVQTLPRATAAHMEDDHIHLRIRS